MRRILCALCAFALALSLAGCGKQQEEPAQISLFAMDTYMTIYAYGENGAEAVAAAGRAINDLESAISRTMEGSDIQRLNDCGMARVSDTTRDVLALALEFAENTGGAFDITVAPLVSLWNITGENPHVATQEEIDTLLPFVGSEHVHLDGNDVSLDAGCAVDLGGIGKGYAAAQVYDVLKSYGVEHAFLSLGGNVLVMGGKPDGKQWTVAIQDPAKLDDYAAYLALGESFVVTSGGYQRFFTADDGTVYQHILDPHTGAPAHSDLTSVTIVTTNGTLADAYSTALYVMGEAGAVDFWRARGGDDGFEMVLITEDGRLLYTPGLSACISAPKGCRYVYQAIA